MFGLMSGGESRPPIEFIDIWPPPPIPPEFIPDELPTLLSSESETSQMTLLVHATVHCLINNTYILLGYTAVHNFVRYIFNAKRKQCASI